MGIKSIAIECEQDDGEILLFKSSNCSHDHADVFHLANILDTANVVVARPGCLMAELCKEYLERQDRLTDEEWALHAAATKVVLAWEQHDIELDKRVTTAGNPAETSKK
jgi:hypothetical protein